MLRLAATKSPVGSDHLTRVRRSTTRRSAFGTLIAAVIVMASFWLPGAVASASPAGGGSIAGMNGAALSGGNGGCFFAGCGTGTVAGGGGGASSVQLCSATDPDCVTSYYTADEPRLVVAGGGGGAGGYDGCTGGSAGGGIGPASGYGNCNGGGGGGDGSGGAGQQLNCSDGTTGGGGATPDAVGEGGAGEAGQENGTDGAGAIGGDGYTSQASNGGGGGGGGGYYGGGGGGATNDCGAFGNGGGAGSSYSVADMTVGNDTTATPSISLSYGSGPTVQTFNPGPEQTFVVPEGVTSIDVVATGGTGGNNAENDGYGGYGAVVTTTIPATPGQTLYIDVASNGTNQFAAPAPVMSNVSGTATYGGTATLTATLQDDGVGIAGESVDFTLDGTDVGTATTDGGGVASISGASIGSDTAGDYPDDVVASFAGDGTYTSASASGDLVVGQAAQVVSFTSTAPTSPAFGDTYTPTATGGGSGNPITFSIDPATTNNACSISDGTVSFDHAGTCVIDADQAGDTNYAAADTAQQEVSVGQAAQVVSFTSTAPTSPAFGDTYTPTATGGGSDNPVTFSIDPATTNNACSISDGTVSFDHSGTCVIDADQAGDSDYTAADTAQQQVSVDQAAQMVSFTSTAPSSPAFGDTYTPTATGGASGNPVTFSIDPATTNDACSISSGTVSFDHAGTCVIDADQAGDSDYTAADTAQQQVSVDKAAQVVSFTSTAPTSPAFGDTYTPTATGGASGNPVTFSIDPATTNNACSISDGTVSFDHAGTCVIDADQAGDSDYTAADTAQQQVAVGKVAQAVNFTSTAPTSPAFGDTYTPTATGGGSGNPVIFSIDPATTNSACSISDGTVSFDHAGTCVIDADQAGDGDHSAAPTAQQQVTVGKAATTTALTIGPTSLTATVTAPGAPSSTVTGTVDFTVNGNDIGSAPLTNGTATLTHTLAPGSSYNVVGTYEGNGDFVTSSDSAPRTDPTIHAAVHSAKARTAYGWYSHPVTITFTCTAGSGPLSSPCPGPVTLSHSGADQHVSRTVSAVDGGAATAKVTGINIDLTAPKVRVRGLKNGAVYRGTPRQGTCVGHDAQSGVVRCTLHTTVRHNGLTRYVATAVNRAGLKSTVRGSYRMLTIWIPKVPYTQAAGFKLKPGTFNLYVASRTRPRYEWAAPENTTHPGNRPRGGGDAFTRVRGGVWRMPFKITKSMSKRYKVWNLGVEIHHRLYLVRITVR